MGGSWSHTMVVDCEHDKTYIAVDNTGGSYDLSFTFQLQI